MSEILKTFEETGAGSQNALFILDRAGKITAVSAEAKSMFPGAVPQSDFFSLFDEINLAVLQKLFLETRKSEQPTKDIVSVSGDYEMNEFNIFISPLRSENNVYFLVRLSPLKKVNDEVEVRKFWIASSEIEKIISDRNVLAVVDKVKSSFPFTFIEKSKIQMAVNQLMNNFWIKDARGKFILVNDKYAASLGFKSNQLENKNENEFLPKYLVKLFQTIDNYIIDTTNAVILESIVAPLTSGFNKDVEIIEFPICDLDNKVVAIIGITQQSSGKSSAGKGSIIFSRAINNMPDAVLITDASLKVVAYSREFKKLFGRSEITEFKDSELSRVVEKDLAAIVQRYVNDSANFEEMKFNYAFETRGRQVFEISLIKLIDEGGFLSGVQIIIKPKHESDSNIEKKAELYNVLLNSTPEAVFIYDIDTLKFLEVNQSALRLYGYNRNDFLSMDLTDLYAPEDIQALIESGESKITNGEYNGPWRHKRKDGTSVLVEIKREEIEFTGRKCHFNMVRDANKDVETSRKLQLFQSVYENTSELIVNTDKDGFITYANDPVIKKLGYSQKDLEKRPFISLASDSDRGKINKSVFQSDIAEPVNLEAELKKSSGDIIKVSITASPIKDFNGETESYNLIVRILDENRETEGGPQTRVESRSHIDPPFLSTVFHELLTPINVIIGFVQELAESIGTPNDEQKEAIDIIQENQKLLLQIMDNAVEFSSLEQKVIKLKPENLVFSEILDELKENTRKTAEQMKVELSYGKISSSLSLETDKQKLTSLLTLIIKFALQITKEKTIYLSAFARDDNSCAVSVKDGRGLISPYLVKGFKEIFSADENMTRRNYGFSRFTVRLAQKLIELLSAKTEIILKDGEQTEFALIFPLKFVVPEKAKTEVESVESRPPQPSLKVESIVTPVEHKPKVENIIHEGKKKLDLTQLSCLYLEDQVDSQILFKVQMKDFKSIEFASSFESALPLLKTKKFDVIFIDINLQGEYNGLDAMKIIQKMPGYKNIPLIASTAYALPDDRNNFIAAGFTDYVSKPLLREKVLETLRNIIP